MSHFLGSEICILDAKGRLSIPARMRRNLAPEANDTFVIVRGFDPCVNMYPLDEWQRFEDQLRELKRGNSDAREFVRSLYETAHESTLDSQGRISLTDRLLEFAGVTKEAKVLGLMDRIEIWNPKRLDDRQRGVSTEKLDDLARKLLS
jgi:MraZ protein